MKSSAVRDLFENFWKWRISEFPEFATFIGDHSYDDKLQSYSIESIKKRKVTVAKFLDEATQLSLDQSLEAEDKINLTYFMNDLKVFINGMEAKGYYFPISFLDGVHLEYERLFDATKRDSATDYFKMIDRSKKLPEQISEIIQIMREGIKKKMTFHIISISGVLKQLEVLLQQKPEETLLFKCFMESPENDPEFKFKDEACEHGKKESKNFIKFIEQKLFPAFLELKNFLEKEYFQHVRPAIAISSLNNGKHIYQMCLDYHLSCTMTPEEIHEIGLKEVERIKMEIQRIIKSLNLNMSVREFSDYIRKQDQFCFQTVDELLDTYKRIVFNDIVPKMPKVLDYLPSSKLEIETFPSSSPNAPQAYYYAGTLEGKPGKFLVNVTDLKASPKYEAVTLALHEAIPGHHLQTYYLMESENIPNFRRYLEDRRYTEAPSLFPLYTAYVEGWGLYCEHLGYELGLYSDAYLEFGHLSYEIFRACRLVIDTGIHAFGWSRDKAIDYFLENTALHTSEIENEVDRYITWPGQACGYKIGELKIKALRKLAEDSLGSKFNISDFHHVVLKSFGPLHLLEERVKEYIEKELKNA